MICPGKDGVANFDALHSRAHDHIAVACAFDLLMLNGDDMQRRPFAERKAALSKLLFRSRGGVFKTSNMSNGTATRCLPPSVTLV